MIELNNIFEKTVTFLPNLGLGIIVLSLFVLLSWLTKRIITRRIKPKTKNPLMAVFLGKLVAFAISVTGFIFFLNVIGLGGIAKHIIAGAGITTFIIGFAFKDIGENFLSGILMAFKSPFKIGDLIETNGTVGYVNELNTSDSVIKTFDGIDVYIPNSQLIKAPLFNYTIDGFLRYEINFGLDYSSDIKKIKELIVDVLHNIPEVLQGDKKPVVVIDELSVSTVNIKVLYWIDTFKSKSRTFHLQVKTKVMAKLLEEFNANNIYLPADIIELKNYRDTVFISNKLHK